MLKRILSIVGFIIILLLIDWEWVSQLREGDASLFIEGIGEEVGYNLLLITIPLFIIQGVITLFPVVVLIIVHFISFGLFEGFIFSLIGSFFGSLFCYWLATTFSEKAVARFWDKKKKSLDRLLKWITNYGILILVGLRSIPIMPSNLISISAAFSPITISQYVWSSVWGNISMIWLLSLLSAPLWISKTYFMPYLVGYLSYMVILLAYYGYHYVKEKGTVYNNEH